MTRIKNVVFLLMVIMMVVPATLFAGQRGGEDQLHIVYVTPLVASEVWLVSKEGFDDAAAEFGFKGDWVGPIGIDIDAMIKQIEIAIAEKADGIITCGLNPEAMGPVMRQADAAGIPVVLINAGSQMDAPYFAYIGTEGEALGRMAAEQAMKYLGDKAPEVIYMGSTITNSSVIDTTNGYKEFFSTVPGYKELTLAENQSDMNISFDKWQNLYVTYPEVNVAACVDPFGAIAANAIAEERGIRDQLVITSIDDIPQVLDAIKAGEIDFTMSQNYYRMGYEGARWIVEYLTDGTPPPAKINDSGTLVIDKSNVDTFGASLRDKSLWN